MNTYDEYCRHGVQYRAVNDLSRPWVPSPVSSAIALPNEIYTCAYDANWAPPKAPPIKLKLPNYYIDYLHPRRNRLVRRLRKLLRLDKPFITYEIPMYHPLELNPPMPPYPPIHLSEWKAYGYYSCPAVNGCHVSNRSMAPPPSISVAQLFEALRSPGGGQYPERWVRGIRHPALPPPPRRWKKPNPYAPQPFAWECYLNPWLAHDPEGGPSIVKWDIGMSPDTMLLNLEESDALIPLSDADRCQPATYPFVSHLVITSVHVEDHPVHSWRIMVINKEGITCDDVFKSILESYDKEVGEVEYASWDYAVQEGARAVNAWRQLKQYDVAAGDVIRRRDYLGWNYMFDGLTVNPNHFGWTLHLARGKFVQSRYY